MKNAILVMVHLLARLAVLLGTGGTRAVLAENILLSSSSWSCSALAAERPIFAPPTVGSSGSVPSS